MMINVSNADPVVACPHCSSRERYNFRPSTCVFHWRGWTDGKRIKTNTPPTPLVVKCHNCAHCYWFGDANQVGSVESVLSVDMQGMQLNPEWLRMPAIREPSEQDFYDALENGLARDKGQERTLRILAWWRSNDEFRDKPDAVPEKPGIDGRRRQNLVRLANLLSQKNDHDYLMKAEVLRELGAFDFATHYLDRVQTNEYSEYAAFVRRLCDEADTLVRETEPYNYVSPSLIN